MSKIYSEKMKQEARNLRELGWSLGEISLKMKIPKNTLSEWVKDIHLSGNQLKRIRKKITDSAAIGRPLAVKANREKIEKWKLGIRKKVKHFAQLAQKNPEISRLICGVLYLCEGAKYPSSRYLYFGNSDPKIISLFIGLLRKHYPINETKLRIGIHYRCDQNFSDLRKYWSQVTKIPVTQCLITKPDIRSKGKRTLRKGYKGVCRVIYYDTSLQFELQSIGEAIL